MRAAPIAAALGCCSASAAASALQRPNIFFVLQDDYGWHDFHGPELAPFHGNLTALAIEGIMLTNHLVHYHCSPTRRSFISGRLPIHHGEELSPTLADNVDLRWSLISDKLKHAGYATHWVGKGHVGFLSTAHLPTHRGFDSFTGFLSGGQSYTSSDRWHNEGPLNVTTYSSDLYGQRAVEITAQHPIASGPLFIYLPWQAVHSPYDLVPGFDCESKYPPYPGVYAGMLNEADIYMGQLRATLKQREMWDNSLIVYSSDNGGVSENGLAGVNYPLRGEKHTNWAGGYRVAAFVSGGVVPAALRGTSSNLRLHVVDWYPTFCAAAGISKEQCADDSPTKPLPVDPSDVAKDIYSNGAWPGLDGVDVWPMLLKGSSGDIYEAHHTLVISEEVILVGEHKLLVGQGHVNDSGPKTRPEPQGKQPPTDGWHEADGSWTPPPPDSCGLAYHTSKGTARGLPGWSPANYGPMQQGTHFIPCLFNETNDRREKTDISAANTELVTSLWKQLNATVLTTFKARSPASMMGPCNPSCAMEHWKSLGSTTPKDGPVCGVPGCTDAGHSNSIA